MSNTRSGYFLPTVNTVEMYEYVSASVLLKEYSVRSTYTEYNNNREISGRRRRCVDKCVCMHK